MNAPSTADMSVELELVRNMVREAGDLLVGLRPKLPDIGIHGKGPFDLVSDADMASHELISRRILERFPHDSILSEEGADVDHRVGRCWIVDPLDGDREFPAWAGSCLRVGGPVRRGQPKVAAVRAPFFDQTYWAASGQGAFRDGQPLEPGPAVPPERALIGVGFPADRSGIGPLIDRLHPLLREFGDVRRLASPALDICWVADGRLDAFLDSVKIWDIAAAGLIAAEAGLAVECVEEDIREPEPPAGRSYLVAPERLAQGILAAMSGIGGNRASGDRGDTGCAGGLRAPAPCPEGAAAFDGRMCLDRVTERIDIVDVGVQRAIADCPEQVFRRPFQVLALRDVVHDGGPGDEQGTPAAEVLDDVDGIRRARHMAVGRADSHGPKAVQ